MIKFKQFITESLEHLFSNRAIGMISAPPEHIENLRSDLEKRGHIVHDAEGHWEGQKEHSFLVAHHHSGNDKGAIAHSVVSLGKKYKQDSVLLKPHHSTEAYLHGTKSDKFPGMDMTHPIGAFHLGASKGNYSKVRGQSFHFGESLTEDATGESLTDGGKKMLQYAHEYADTVGGSRTSPSMQSSSAEKQIPIAHAYHVAASGDPEYKKHVFKAYQDQHPDLIKSTGAKDYDQLVHHSYKAMEHETEGQYKTLSKHIKFDFHGGDKDYANSDAMRNDLHNNHHMDVFNGGDKHEFLNKEDSNGVNTNHKFRAVHDAFGHGILKNGFGPKGEETAWHIHHQTYSPLARPAMTAETRGQNSWVNYSGVNKGRDPKNTIFAKQKAVLLPPEMNRPDYNGEVPHYLKKHMNTPITESKMSKKLREIVESLSDTRTTRQKMQDLHDHPATEPHLKARAAEWLNKDKPKSHPWGEDGPDMDDYEGVLKHHEHTKDSSGAYYNKNKTSGVRFWMKNGKINNWEHQGYNKHNVHFKRGGIFADTLHDSLNKGK